MDWSQLVPNPVDWWHVILAVVAVGVGWIAGHFARKGVLALSGRLVGVSPGLAQAAARGVYYLLLLLGVGIALALLGANVQPLLGMVIILLVVAVLVLRGVADNFAAGVLIQTRQTVKVGDEIQVEGPDGTLVGTVTELNSRAVLLLTVDGRTVHVPNATLLSEPFVNNSTHGARRSEVQVRLARMGRAVTDLTQLLVEATVAVDGVHSREHVRALTTAVSPERLTVRVQFWHHPLHGVPVTADVIGAISESLESAGIAATVTSDPGLPPLVPSDPV